MQAVFDLVKSLKLWQAIVILAVLVGAGGAAYGVYAVVSGSGQVGPGEDQQLIPVQYGNLVNQVSTNGSLIFPNREILTFGTQGTVEEMLVEEGQQVEEGQPLARLDAATVASLEKVVAQARVNLRNAEDALAEAKDPHTLLDLAQAEASVANARLALKNAQEALDEVKNGPTEEDIAKAQSQVDSADTALTNALGDLRLTQREWDEKVQVAQNALDAALEGYQDVLILWFGIEVDEEEVNLDPDTLLDSWAVDLASLFDPNLRFEDVSKGWWAEGPPPDDPATPWNEPVVYAWLNFFPGPIALTCESGVVPFLGRCIQKEIDDAWDAYQGAKDNLDTVQTQAAKTIANAEVAVTKAEEILATARETLADLKAGPDPLEVDIEEKQLMLAQANLTKAEEDLVEMKGSVDLLEVALREAELTAAQAALDTALARLEGSTIKALMAGVISLVNVEVGQNVNANTPIVEIVNPTVVELDGIVDEIDVLFVREGARATVVMDALPGQVLEGTVSLIASAARSQQGVVSYPIRIQIQVPEGVELREGLSATASIVIREERNVLLVPLQALYGSFEQPVVRLLVNERIEERPVVLGNSDDFWVVVREGLAEGDQVVMETTQAATSQFGFGGGFRQFQRAFPGGGGGGFGGGQGRQDEHS